MICFNKRPERRGQAFAVVPQSFQGWLADGKARLKRTRRSALTVAIAPQSYREPHLFSGAGFALIRLAAALIIALVPSGASGLTVDLGAMGHINWESAQVVVHGSDKAALDASPEQAAEAARFNLFSSLKTIRIVGSLTVAGVVKDDLPKSEKLLALIQSVPVASQKEQAGGPAAATLSFSMRGAFSQLMLPADIQQIEAVTPLGARHQNDNVGNADSEDSSAHGRFTGLIIDARGIDLEPALVVRVVDENGELLYGPQFSSRDYAVSWGMVGYASGAAAVQDQERLGAEPLRVEALRVAGVGRSDLTVSNSTADKVRGLPEHVSFFRECRIVIRVN